jgi:hypothetical protein
MKVLGLVALALILSFGLVYAADQPMGGAGKDQPMGSAAKADTKAVKGEVLKIEGENYTVKDDTGKEVKLHVSKDTQKQGTIKVGDKIEAQVEASGHAQSIKAAAQ